MVEMAGIAPASLCRLRVDQRYQLYLYHKEEKWQ